jgi:hypothetical protein
MKWKILKSKEAHKLKIRILRAGPERYLEINLSSIHKGMSVDEFIDFIESTGIVLNANCKKHKKRKK